MPGNSGEDRLDQLESGVALLWCAQELVDDLQHCYCALDSVGRARARYRFLDSLMLRVVRVVVGVDYHIVIRYRHPNLLLPLVSPGLPALLHLADIMKSDSQTRCLI